MDKNKDGFITKGIKFQIYFFPWNELKFCVTIKGELKLAKKSVGMNEINDVIKRYDIDKDGKLNMDEFKKSSSSSSSWLTAKIKALASPFLSIFEAIIF